MPNLAIQIGLSSDRMRQLGNELIETADRRKPDRRAGGECEHIVYAQYNGPGEVVLTFSNDDMEAEQPEGIVYVDVDEQ